jgi:predicted nucleic acid-binding Zn ribbon protein
MDAEIELRKLVKWRQVKRTEAVIDIGDAAKKYFEKNISPQHDRTASLAEIWSALIPVQLHKHCRIDILKGAQLKVIVDSPSYLHELRLCSSELLEQLKKQCPKARIKDIKFVIGSL